MIKAKEMVNGCTASIGNLYGGKPLSRKEVEKAVTNVTQIQLYLSIRPSSVLHPWIYTKQDLYQKTLPHMKDSKEKNY